MVVNSFVIVRLSLAVAALKYPPAGNVAVRMFEYVPIAVVPFGVNVTEQLPADNTQLVALKVP